MREIIIKFGIFCGSVVIMLMTGVLIIAVHIAKFVRKFFYAQESKKGTYCG